jgi:hypothetical protein
MNLCLCTHSQDHHSRNAAGPHMGPCLAPLCGCMWFRPDPEAKEAA